MKQILTSVAAVALFASTVNACNTFKSGFTAGVGVGFKREKTKLQKNYNPSAVTVASGGVASNVSQSSHANKALGEISFGYNFIKNKLYSGLEFDYRYSPAKNSKSSLITYDSSLVNKVSSVSQKHKHDIGLTGKLGTLVRPNLAVYAIGNVRYGKFTTNFDRGNAAVFTSQKKSKKLFGFGGGLGMAYVMQNCTSVALDVTYDTYKKMKKTIQTNVDADSMTFGAKKTHVLNAIVKLKKTF